MVYGNYFAYLDKKRKLIVIIMFIFSVAAMSYITYRRISNMPNVDTYQGDGQFKNISQRLGLIAIPGYCIKMPPLDLSKPIQMEYRLERLPVPPRQCYVYFAINTDDDTWEKRLRKTFRAKLRLQLRDLSGQIVLNLDGNLSDYTAYSSTRMDFIALYPWNENTSFFPTTHDSYIMSIAYVPDPKLNDYQGFVYLEAGGSK